MRASFAVVGLVALVAAACAGSSAPSGPTATPAMPVDGALIVRAFEFGFEPSRIVLRQGEKVTLVLDNEGDILHNLKVDEIEADVIESESSGPLSGGEGSFFIGADDHDQGTLVFAPLEAGAYAFYCTIDDHRLRGMEGTFVVE